MHFGQITSVARNVYDFHELTGMHSENVSLNHPFEEPRAWVFRSARYIQCSIKLFDKLRVEWCFHSKQPCQILCFNGFDNVLKAHSRRKASEVKVSVAE